MSREKIKKLFSDKRVRIVSICVLALLLLLVVWKVFFPGNTKASSVLAQQSEQEARLSAILNEIEGVDGATVLISESAGEVVGAVVVIRGQDSILTRMRVIDVVSNALNLKKEKILVYPAN